MSKIATPEFKNDSMAILNALAYTSYGLLWRFSNFVISLRIVFEMKLTMIIISGTKMIKKLSMRYLGHHSSQ